MCVCGVNRFLAGLLRFFTAFVCMHSTCLCKVFGEVFLEDDTNGYSAQGRDSEKLVVSEIFVFS